MNIENMSLEELCDLNRRVVARIQALNQFKQQFQMINFSLGEKVQFRNKQGERVVGVLTKYNRKTVSILTEDGLQWRVSPTLLSKAGTSGSDDVEDAEIIEVEDLSGGDS